MDSLTQAVLGAGIQGALLGRFQGRKALLYGAVLATLPDLDVLIDQGDPVSAMINHRGFSHSLLVLTGAAAVLTGVIRSFAPSTRYSAARLFLTLWLVLVTHPLLDAFTSYGTQLWWPFTPTPTAWSSVFIIDPLFTLPLLAVFIAGLVKGLDGRATRACAWALGWCALYLGASLGAKHIVETRVRDTLQAEGTQVLRLFSTPSPLNILLWRVVAHVPDDHYVEAIAGVFDRQPFERARLPLNSGYAAFMPDSPQLPGLRWFTGDWLRYDRIGPNLVVTDLRMGLATGFYTFRFRIGDGPPQAWHPVTPSMWPSNRGGTDELRLLGARIVGQARFPLDEWETRMHAPAP